MKQGYERAKFGNFNREGEDHMKAQTYVIFGIIFLIIVSIFAVSNVETVKVNYIIWTGESPLILVILFSVLMGGIITATVGSLKIFRLQRENKFLKTENDRLEKQLRVIKQQDVEEQEGDRT